RERRAAAGRARAAADGHLRRVRRHLRELRGSVAEPVGCGGGGRGGGARAGKCCGCSGRCWVSRASSTSHRTTCSRRCARSVPASSPPAMQAVTRCSRPAARARSPRPSRTCRCTRPTRWCAAHPRCRRPAKAARRRRATEAAAAVLQTLTTTWLSLPDYARSTAWILVITVVLIISVALLTLWERKVIGWMQLRRGPNRVRIFGLLPGFGQPFADVVKLLTKEVVIPTNSSRFLFRIAPMIALVPAFAAWAVIPLSPEVTVSKADAGLLYL